jgi:hypothetical protein
LPTAAAIRMICWGLSMGVAFCVVFKKDVPPYGKLGGDSKLLVDAYEKLDAVAEANGLRTLGSFLSCNPDEAAGMLEDMGVDPDEVGLEQEQWFDASHGLSTVQALMAKLRDHSKAMAKSKQILSELHDVETELKAAVAKKVKFHFELVP